MTKAFETYEQVATYLLNEFAEHFGLQRVEGKQHVPGHITGTRWEIDAKGVKEDSELFVIVECRRYTSSKVKQKDLGGLAYSIMDTGAAGGIIVTPLGIQEGAAKVAGAAGIVSVQLDPASTTSDYVLRFLDKAMIGASLHLNAKCDMTVSFKVWHTCAKCGEQFNPKAKEIHCSRCAS